MMNLQLEMKKRGVSLYDMQSVLGCTERTVRNKLSGATDFSYSEVLKIRDSFFPGMQLEYLFAMDDVRKE